MSSFRKKRVAWCQDFLNKSLLNNSAQTKFEELNKKVKPDPFWKEASKLPLQGGGPFIRVTKPVIIFNHIPA